MYLALFIIVLWYLVPYEDTLAYKLTERLEERKQLIENASKGAYNE